MKYTTNVTSPNGYLITEGTPFDVRLVLNLKSDLIDVSKFGDEDTDYRYKGMIVAVVDDTTADNNGVYICTSDSFNYDSSDYQCWTKLLSFPEYSESLSGVDIGVKWNPIKNEFEWTPITTGSGSGAEELNDLNDVTLTNTSSGQALVFNGSSWVNSTISTGSGSGVTTADIDYSLLFASVNQGGLGYQERGTEGKGLGYLRKNEVWDGDNQSHNCLIPQGTSYQQIFEKILVGEASTSAQNYSTGYTGSNISYPSDKVSKPSNWTATYSDSQSGPFTNSFQRSQAGTYQVYIKITDNNGNDKGTLTAQFTITKKSCTITPRLTTSTINVGDQLAFTEPPTLSSVVSNDRSAIESAISDFGQNNNRYKIGSGTVDSGTTWTTVGSSSVTMNSVLISNLNSLFTNYSFTAGNTTLTTNPRIQYLTYLDSGIWQNYLTSSNTYYQSPYNTLIGSQYPGITNCTNGKMIPFIHDTVNGAFRLRILSPYKLDDSNMLYWDPQNTIWKAKTGEQFDGFGTPTQVIESGLTWNIYTYSGNTSTSPLAVNVIHE